MHLIVKTTSDAFGLESNNSRQVAVDDLLDWFALEYNIHSLINDFWGTNAKARLIAVTKDIKDQSWKGLVSEWDTGSSMPGQFRVNKTFIESLLRYSLGDTGRPFKLKEITELELAFFENFFINLENYWKDFWKLTIPNSNGTFIYLIWCIEIDDRSLGSLAIGVPPGIVPKTNKVKNKVDFRSLMSQLDIEVPLDLTVGKSKLKISDIKTLEAGDLIVFENSSIDYLTWKKSDMDQLTINIEIPSKDNSRFADLYYDDLEIDNMVDEHSNSEDLLTDLPVELTAQFKSVHMPLNKILELESGGILPLGLLIDSQLTLVAPGDKPIAAGNLVIVGNQFGIRINKLNIKKSMTAKLNNYQSSYIEAPMPSQAPKKAPVMQVAENLDEDLDQELEDIGIDPKELDELEDLY
ncbi:MAG: FliM/FliN family flagellar motor switch protein [Candidatus Caenarcaniphilales bacterium]|nr:FliM/FliN family flagellar motor switch protein [Candidatus Caenarcaniphilales bacterium]